MAESQAESSTATCLHALRECGAEQIDPVRYAYLNALARRAAEQPAVLRERLDAKIAEEAERLKERCKKRKRSKAKPEAAAVNSPLAELLAYLASHGEESPAEPLPTMRATQPASPSSTASRASPPPRELKSIAYFRESWAQLHTEQQLTQTLAQAPENAGPMNSQHLALRALKLMRDHAPAYLQGFMSYVDALIWLEHAAPLKPAERGRAKSNKR